MSFYERSELTKAYLVYVPPMHDQYHRPYEADVRGQGFDLIMDATNGGLNLTPAAFSMAASGILMPSSIPVQQVNIDNGFDTGRYAFFLEITTSTPYGTEREIIKGYTNYDGVSFSGHIDPNMIFHVNERVVLSVAQVTNASGQYEVPSFRAGQLMIAALPFNQDATCLAPEDVVAYQQHRLMHEGGTAINDPRFRIQGVAQLRNKDYSIPSNYLADTCTGYIGAMQHGLSELEDPSSKIYSEVMGKVRTGSVMLSSLYNNIGQNDPTKSHTFFYHDLERVWPRQDGFWTVVKPKPAEQISFREYTSEWKNALPETNVAYMLSHMMPAFMSRFMLERLTIAITNMTPGNQVLIQPMGYVEMFQGVMTESLMINLCNQIELEVVRGILNNRAGIYNLYLSIDLMTNSMFDISLNGGEVIPYAVPMFCTSQYSPMVGLDHDNLSHLSASIEDLALQLSNAKSSTSIRRASSWHDHALDIQPANNSHIPVSNYL